jgi:hypothetical protein
VALGAQAVSDQDPSIATWLAQVVENGADLLGSERLPQMVVELVRMLQGGTSRSRPVGEPASLEDRALLLWSSAAFPAVQLLARPLDEVVADLVR